MPTMLRCPSCKKPIDTIQADGLCAECLMRQVVLDEPPHDQPNAVPETAALGAESGGFQPPSPAALSESFPELEVFQLIGQGGMGAVYRARQKSLDRVVALKILPPNLSSDPTFAERFTREAQAMARLNHPNIVTSFEVGQQGPYYYLLMEYVDGVNLREAIRDGQIESGQALSVVSQICDALQYAHDEGIVHRDIKPENILVDKRGRVKIADFGLAKMLRRTPVQLTLTGTNQVMGTLHYMAPEQVEHPLDVDHRADLFSLGVVFYEMMTGHLPLGRFELPSEKGACDPRLDEVVLKALQREPARRYQYADEVKTDVSQISSRPPKAAPVEPPVRPQATVAPAQELRHRQLRDRIEPVARSLMWVGYGGAVLICSSPLLLNVLWQDRAGPSLRLNFSWIVFLFIAVPCLLQAVFIGNAGLALKPLRSYRRTLVLLIVGLIPISPVAILGWPFLIWAISLITRPGAKEIFAVGDRLAGTEPSNSQRAGASSSGVNNLLVAAMLFFGLLVAVVFAMVIVVYAISSKPPAVETDHERSFRDYQKQNSGIGNQAAEEYGTPLSDGYPPLLPRTLSLEYQLILDENLGSLDGAALRQIERACEQRIKTEFDKDNGVEGLADSIEVSVGSSGRVRISVPDLPGIREVIDRRLNVPGMARFCFVPNRHDEPRWTDLALAPSVIELRDDGRVIAKWFDVHDACRQAVASWIESGKRSCRDADGGPQVLIWNQEDPLSKLRVHSAVAQLDENSQHYRVVMTTGSTVFESLAIAKLFEGSEGMPEFVLLMDEQVLLCRFENATEESDGDTQFTVVVNGEFDRIEAEDLASILAGGPIFGQLVRVTE